MHSFCVVRRRKRFVPFTDYGVGGEAKTPKELEMRNPKSGHRIERLEASGFGGGVPKVAPLPRPTSACEENQPATIPATIGIIHPPPPSSTIHDLFQIWQGFC